MNWKAAKFTRGRIRTLAAGVIITIMIGLNLNHNIGSADLILPIYRTIKEFPKSPAFNESVWMRSTDGMFKYSMFHKVGKQWNQLSERKVCISSHCSLDRLVFLPEVSEHWSGPLSILLFIYQSQYSLSLRIINYLAECFPSLERVSFHLLYSVEENITTDSSFAFNYSCSDYKELLSRIPKFDTTLLYPQNLARNLARQACQTEYILVTDIDMFPARSLSEQMDRFLQLQEQSKNAWVLPVYELEAELLPSNKTELIRLIQKGTAQYYHKQSWSYNQGGHNPGRWERLDVTDELSVAYTVESYQIWYEPVYISRNNCPYYDERFSGYGFDRVSQVSRAKNEENQ